MSDLVKRLRDGVAPMGTGDYYSSVYKDMLIAAHRIEHLERDLAQAVAALEIIAAQHSGEVGGTSRSDCMAAIARASLGTIDLSLLDKKE